MTTALKTLIEAEQDGRLKAKSRLNETTEAEHLVSMTTDEVNSFKAKLKDLKSLTDRLQKLVVDFYYDQRTEWLVRGTDVDGVPREFRLFANPEGIELSDANPRTMYSRVFRITKPQELKKTFEGYTDVSWGLISTTGSIFGSDPLLELTKAVDRLEDQRTDR